jgi:hypothetical protein
LSSVGDVHVYGKDHDSLQRELVLRGVRHFAGTVELLILQSDTSDIANLARGVGLTHPGGLFKHLQPSLRDNPQFGCQKLETACSPKNARCRK